jgi:thymidylate synthase (FAD)
MKIIQPTYIIEDEIDGKAILRKLEKAGRTCYKSEDKANEASAEKMIRMLIKNGHESVLEHEKITVRIICDRGVTHEIVRHRIASYSQESTRYCNYSGDKFGNELTFIRPCFWNSGSQSDIDNMKRWEEAMAAIEKTYIQMIENGATPEQARSILPNSIKTEIVVTMNMRAWRNFFKLRTAKAAHPQMREIATLILDGFKQVLPVLFEDIE